MRVNSVVLNVTPKQFQQMLVEANNPHRSADENAVAALRAAGVPSWEVPIFVGSETKVVVSDEVGN